MFFFYLESVDNFATNFAKLKNSFASCKNSQNIGALEKSLVDLKKVLPV